MKQTYFNSRLDPETTKKLDALAKLYKVNRSEALRMALHEMPLPQERKKQTDLLAHVENSLSKLRTVVLNMAVLSNRRGQLMFELATYMAQKGLGNDKFLMDKLGAYGVSGDAEIERAFTEAPALLAQIHEDIAK